MVKAKKPQRPASPSPIDDDEERDYNRVGSQFKLIAELITDTDQNLPSETIDQDVADFSNYSDHSDWRGIPKYFDSLSSMSRRASTYNNWENRFKVADYLISCFIPLRDAVTDYITNYFDSKENEIEHVVDVELVNTVNMFVILVQRLTVQLQLYVSKSAAVSNQAKRGAGRNKHADTNEDAVKWKEYQRDRMINCLIELLELRVETATGTKKKAIQYVFVPDVMEIDFLRRFMDTVNQLLEDPENAARASQPWITHYFKIWKVLAADFGMSKSIANCLFTGTLELNYLETANSFPFIEPLVHLMKESAGNGANRLNVPLRIVLEMVVRRACSLYSGDRVDRPPPKAYCMIIQALAVNVHDLMLQELVQVYQLLHNPHPNVRMCTLQALADMFSSPYLSQTLCDDHRSRKMKRLAIFKKIVAHTNDEATNVRAKAVSLLRILMENRRIPEEFESVGFLTIVGSRIQDKSVQVRKSAIQFLTTFLDNNRHGHDFNRQDHLIKLDGKLRELRNMNTPNAPALQRAEQEISHHQFNLRRNMKQKIIDLINNDIDFASVSQPKFPHETGSLNDPATAHIILVQYAQLDNFPFKNRDGEPTLKSDAETIEKIFQWVFDKAKNDYIYCAVQLEQLNDERAVENEQEQRDRLHSVLQLRAQVQQLIDKMSIEMELSHCIKKAVRCVLMGETAEIKEGIKFLTRCKLFEITGAEEAIRSMCSLVWRPTTDVLNELIEAAEDMFISRLDGNEKASERDKSTVENLMKAMNGVTENERPSVEEVIYLLAAVDPSRDNEDRSSRTHRKRKTIEPNVITRLWAIALDSTDVGTQRKIDALRILYPISKTERGIPEARARLRSLQKKLMEEPAIAVEALRIISILATPTTLEKGKDSIHRPLFRINQDDSLFKSMEHLFFHEVVKANDDPKRDWFGIIRLTISTILNVSMDVNAMLPRLAAHFLYRAKKVSEFYIFYSKQAEDSQDDLKRVNAVKRRDYWALTWCRVMEKLVAFCGEVAVQLHAYIQVTVPKLHQRYISKMLDAEEDDSKTREEPIRFLSELEKSVAQRKTIFAVPQDTTPGTATNELHHLVSLMCDKRIFLPHKLLGRLLPIVVYAMRVKTMPERIRQAAIVAYGKFMPISAEVSAFAAPAFFTAMVNSSSALVRCNLIAACCDFAFSQPTLFELYAPSLFRMSQDRSSAARESTILVLSHLMSNDMIQTRGVLSEPARCICDDVASVREAAQSFFREVNSRSDTIIQLLPEFLYRLSSTKERMPFKSFKTVFEFLIQLLKEKTKSNTDSMIDRVCLKFSSIDMNDTESPKYLLVALAKFAQNDGGLHRLQDNWRHWSKFLCHPQVAKEYRAMLENMGSSSKNEEVKAHCEELVRNINKIQEEGLRKEDVSAMPTTSKRTGRGRKPAVKTDSTSVASTRTPKRKRRPVTPSSDESEESEPESD